MFEGLVDISRLTVEWAVNNVVKADFSEKSVLLSKACMRWSIDGIILFLLIDEKTLLTVYRGSLPTFISSHTTKYTIFCGKSASTRG